MKKQELKSIIKECVREILQERVWQWDVMVPSKKDPKLIGRATLDGPKKGQSGETTKGQKFKITSVNKLEKYVLVKLN